jgi:spermidine/putrescine transport system ATP-binding protein
MSAPRLELAGLRHFYGKALALDDVALTVETGEFITILGPSGSGKTTLLRVIGGFEMPREAAVLRIDGADMRGLPPNRRPLATVFQHYALFPHLSVGENVGYGLKVRRVAAAERHDRAQKALDLVRLPGKYDRSIQQLSGGERQRVAFARALVTEPLLLLLDEPMGALDERLREEMQVEIRGLQRQLGMTILQVTHSREEALTMSDRIAVMKQGRIEQLGTPAEIFERPATRFVAEFMGLTNILAGRIGLVEPDAVRIDCGDMAFWGPWTGARPAAPGEAAFLAIHPERLDIAAPTVGRNRLAGRPRATTYRGTRRAVSLDTGLGAVTASLAAGQSAFEGETIISWRPEDGAIGPMGG